MEKYFDLVLDLLELDNQEELKMLARNLEKEQKAGHTVFFAHRYDFLFQARLAFLEEKISLEEFVQIGDVDSQIGIYNQEKKSLKEILDNLMNKIPEQEVFVIDQDAWNLFLSEKNKKELEKKLAQSQKKLYFIS